MVTVNTKQRFKDFSGSDLLDVNEKKIYIGSVLSNVCGSKTQNPHLGWILGKKFATKDKVELKAEEVVFLKETINTLCTSDKGWLSSLMAGQLLEILDS